MKKKVLLLNYQERKGFEEVYQCLVNFQKWKMENIFIDKTSERDQFNRLPYRNLPLAFHPRKYKTTRLDVASHEAGHAIAFAAVYFIVDKAVIDLVDHPDGLLGFVAPLGHKEGSDHQPIAQEGMPCKPTMIRNILIDSGGFVGQSFVGKKTGSLHEKFMIYCQSRYLDDRDEVEPLTNWNHYVGWCRNILLNNQNLFWKVTDDLLANSVLTESGKALLHSSTKKEPTQLFFNQEQKDV